MNFSTGNFKQKNRKFKGTTKAKKQKNQQGVVSTSTLL